MDELVKTVNELQEVFAVTGCREIDLPQVAVIGAQSSGKSSVLEHLVGRSFLPRGTGVVTRCPLILQLMRAEGQAEEHAIFQHDSTKVFTEYPLITKEIEDRTELIAGNNKGICHTPIILKMYSPSFVNLTVIDLPGLTKVPVGDQPVDIEEHTRKLILEYIENPNCIILAVTAANVDMATSESLKMAREVDPNGERTLAVVTKVDLMDEGTDANEMLGGKIIPVKLGIIGVVNRSQKDIIDGKSINDSLLDEATFFKKRYHSIAAFHGTTYLTKTVQKILKSHIENCLPQLKQRVSEQLANRRAELVMLGDGKEDKPMLLLNLLTKFSNTYSSAIKVNMCNIQTNELRGGARIKYVFQQSLNTALNSVDAMAGLSKDAILTAMQNASGASPSLFVPEVAFVLLVKKQIKQFLRPCLQCVDLVYVELNVIGQSCLEDDDLGLKKYPKLKREMSDVLSELLRKRLPVTNEMVNHFIEVQLAYINSAHPDFVSTHAFATCGNGDSHDPAKKKPCIVIKSSQENFQPLSGQSPPTDKATNDYILIQELIKSYFSVVRMTIQDTVPKLIMHFQVNYAMEFLQSELVGKLYGRDFVELLQESPEIAAQRKLVSASIEALERATHVILKSQL